MFCSRKRIEQIPISFVSQKSEVHSGVNRIVRLCFYLCLPSEPLINFSSYFSCNFVNQLFYLQINCLICFLIL